MVASIAALVSSLIALGSGCSCFFSHTDSQLSLRFIIIVGVASPEGIFMLYPCHRLLTRHCATFSTIRLPGDGVRPVYGGHYSRFCSLVHCWRCEYRLGMGCVSVKRLGPGARSGYRNPIEEDPQVPRFEDEVKYVEKYVSPLLCYTYAVLPLHIDLI